MSRKDSDDDDKNHDNQGGASNDNGRDSRIDNHENLSSLNRTAIPFSSWRVVIILCSISAMGV